MMNRISFFQVIGLIAMLPIFFMSGCSTEKSENKEAAVPVTYTCPMHPQIVQDKPGVCPICSMDLVPFDKSSEGEALVLTANQQALANITTMSLGENSLGSEKMLNGRLVLDPEQTNYVSSRVAGRIDRLFVREVGVAVRKGEPLYQIYSEQLAVLQQEYLLALAQVKQFSTDAKFKQIEEAAKQKLILYGQTSSQIKNLASSKKVNGSTTFFANESGIVAELSITQGQYVEEGGPILRLESYDRLWLEADVYANELASVKVGQVVRVTIPGWENEPQFMKIQFVNPSLAAGSQLLQIRGAIPNPAKRWQVGQQANVFLPTKSKGQVLHLPVDAVIRTGTGTHVWIQTKKNTFEARSIKTGIENFNEVEVLEGLIKGDQVVVSGSYLLNSEYILKRGSDPMADSKKAHAH